jgi:peptide-methionine (R)-S-oxide reductase
MKLLFLLAALMAALYLALTPLTANALMKETDTSPEKIDQAHAVENDQWARKLTPEQFRILRQAGTERPGGAVYEQFKQQGEGDYYCAGCGTHLFTSETKFDSHCGWPSFYDPASIDSVETRPDHSLGRVRTEVVCANCKGHLGHVFTGEGFDTPTDQRFCINGSVLVFVPKDKSDD